MKITRLETFLVPPRWLLLKVETEKGHRWRSPVWRHRDGSLAEW